MMNATRLEWGWGLFRENTVPFPYLSHDRFQESTQHTQTISQMKGRATRETLISIYCPQKLVGYRDSYLEKFKGKKLAWS